MREFPQLVEERQDARKVRETMNDQSILIIDDNHINMKLTLVLLKKNGFTTYSATNAEEALKVLEDVHPHMILMDIQLPGMDGLTLTRQLKANPATRDIIIVAFTAYAMRGDEQKAKDAGCDGYIPKPMDVTTFISMVILKSTLFWGTSKSESANEPS
jgi:CheY-like chemotaxis protein